MNIKDYLSATRSNYTFLNPEKSRFSKLYPLIESALEDDGLEFCLIRSSSCKTEIVELDDKKYVIIDTQIDHYINALALPRILAESNTEIFDDLFFNAIMFIACNELFYSNNATLAKHLYEHYSSQKFAFPHNSPNALAKLFYVVSHEWGHDVVDRNSTVLDDVLTEIDDVYNDLVSGLLRKSASENDVARNFYYQTKFKEVYEKNNRIECAVDGVSALQIQAIMKDDDMFRILLGGYSGYFHSSLVCLHQLTIISEIKNLVKSALAGEEYETISDNELYQRLRITRYLYSRFLVDEIGNDEAQQSWNKFTDYFSSVSSNNIKDVLKQVHRVIASNTDTFTEINNESDNEFCINEFFMQK